MPTKFDVQHYQPNWDPVTGGTFVSVQDVLNATSQMWGEVLTTMIDIIPKSIGDLVEIIAQGMPQLIDALIAEGAALFGFSGATPILEQLIGAGGGTGNTLAEFANLFAAVGVSAEDIALDLFGVSGHSLADLGADFRALLGNPLWGGIFDPIVAAEQWLESVLTPAGALSSSTQIPAHLFGSLSPGNASANLLPDGGFDQPSSVNGEGLWEHDATVGRTVNSSIVGSAKVVAGSVLRQLKGVPIKTAPGQLTSLETYVSWSGVTADAGNAIVLAAQAYDASDNPISDPGNRVLQAISAPAASGDWTLLTGTYQALPGTAYVRMFLEVDATVSAGTVWFDDAVHILNGMIHAALLTNIEDIPQLMPTSVGGYQGINDLLATLGHIADGFGSALANEARTGLDLSSLFGLMQTTAKQAVDAVTMAIGHEQTLGVKVNRPVSHGLNDTSEATFPLAALSAPASSSLTAVAAGTSIQGFWRASTDSVKGFIEFLAQGNGGSGIYVNVFKINPITAARAALWNSTDISALVPNGSLGYVRALIPAGSQPSIKAGDLLWIGIVNAGSGTLSVVTNNYGTPSHPTEIVKNFGGTRSLASTGGSSPTSLTDAQITYSGVVPYVNVGIANVPAGYEPPETEEYDFGSGTYTYVIPPFARVAGALLDLVGVGAGGGGGGSGFWFPGEGGLGGAWHGVTLVCGVDYPVGATSLTVIVGGSGYGGSGVAGGPGNATQFQYTDLSSTLVTVTCAGGRKGNLGGTASDHGGSGYGIGPGDFTYQGGRYFGGSSVYASAGSFPGGGGGGALAYSVGYYGADGYAAITARQT